MTKTVKNDETIVSMSAFTKIVKQFYDSKPFRDTEALKSIKKALCTPEKFCPANLNSDKVYREYDQLEISVDGDYDPHNIDVELLENDILSVVGGISPNEFGRKPFVIAGRFLHMIDDKLYGYYPLEHFGDGHNNDDNYFVKVLEEHTNMSRDRIVDDYTIYGDIQ